MSTEEPAILQPQPTPVSMPPTVPLSRFRLVTTILLLLLVLSTVSFVIEFNNNQALERELAFLQSNYARLQSQYSQSQSTASGLSDELDRLREQLSQNQFLTIWTSCDPMPCTMSANDWRAGGIPDTFEFWPEFTSTTPVAIYFLSLYQYVQFRNCSGSPLQKLSCVGEYRYFPATTSRTNSEFKGATDCASWIGVWIQAGTE